MSHPDEFGPVVLTDDCDTCRGGTYGGGRPVGILCRCGHHFHIGGELLVRTDFCITCPRCELQTSPLALKDPA